MDMGALGHFLISLSNPWLNSAPGAQSEVVVKDSVLLAAVLQKVAVPVVICSHIVLYMNSASPVDGDTPGRLFSDVVTFKAWISKPEFTENQTVTKAHTFLMSD